MAYYAATGNAAVGLFRRGRIPPIFEGQLDESLTGRSETWPPMFDKYLQFLTDESGATAIEYSLIATGIALAIIATVYGIGPKLNTIFSSVSMQLN